MRDAQLGRMVLFMLDGEQLVARVTRLLPRSGDGPQYYGLHVDVPVHVDAVRMALMGSPGQQVRATVATLYVEPVKQGDGPGEWAWPVLDLVAKS